MEKANDNYFEIQLLNGEEVIFSEQMSKPKDSSEYGVIQRNMLDCKSTDDLKAVEDLTLGLNELLDFFLFCYDIEEDMLARANGILVSVMDGNTEQFLCGIRYWRRNRDENYRAHFVDSPVLQYEVKHRCKIPVFEDEGFRVWTPVVSDKFVMEIPLTAEQIKRLIGENDDDVDE